MLKKSASLCRSGFAQAVGALSCLRTLVADFNKWTQGISSLGNPYGQKTHPALRSLKNSNFSMGMNL